MATWLKEAPGLAQDEFIDNIPFAETQTYVKRILGTAEDYRRLYGEDGAARSARAPRHGAPAAAKAAAKPAARPAAKPRSRRRAVPRHASPRPRPGRALMMDACSI